MPEFDALWTIVALSIVILPVIVMFVALLSPLPAATLLAVSLMLYVVLPEFDAPPIVFA